MQFNNLVKYLTSAAEDVNFDAYWNQVILFQKFSTDLSSNEVLKGLPFHSDYSKYQRHTSKLDSNIEGVQLSYQSSRAIPNQSSVTDYLVFPNKAVRNSRISEINSPVLALFFSEHTPTYLSVNTGTTQDFQLGTANFTIDISFYVEEITPTVLGGSIQNIFSVGNPLSTVVINDVLTTSFNGPLTRYYGLFVEGANLFFVCNGTKYQLNTAALAINTWYTLAIQRADNTLQSFIDGTFVREHIFNQNLIYSTVSSAQFTSGLGTLNDTFLRRLNIGATPTVSSGQITGYTRNLVDNCFSGGISNLRITTAARYLSDRYTVSLPLYNALRENALDSDFTNVLVNYPLTYDFFDYGPNSKHFANKEFLYNTPINVSTGGYVLDGTGTQASETIPINLSGTEWTLEFYLTPYVNNLPEKASQGKIYSTIGEFLAQYNSFNSYQLPLLALSNNLLKITTATGGSILEINSHLHSLRAGNFVNSGSHYLSCRFSADGTNWLSFASESGIDLANSAAIAYQPTVLPTNQISFLHSPGSSASYIPEEFDRYVGFNAPYEEPPLHIAIQRFNSFLYIFVNGDLYKTIPFNVSLNSTGAIKLLLNSNHESLVGTLNNTPVQLQLGIKGLKLTNKARYTTSILNDVHNLHSLQPLRVAVNKITPPRARVVDIVRKNISEIVSSDEVEWYVFLSVPVDALTLAKFNLTQIEGISGASLMTITKTSEYEYTIRANTGSGNGKLSLNFIDNNTVTYKNTLSPIGTYIGELSFEGQTYIINKSAPEPILTSGASPYINGAFRVEIRFNSALAQFRPQYLGVTNGFISNIKVLNEILKIYDFLVTPIKEDPVVIQALPGAGVTDNGLLSLASTPLVRIYSKSFPILQLPLNIPSFTNDVSPTRLVLSQTVPNSLVHSTSIAPTGAGSSIDVNPLLEQSGLQYTNFDAIDTNFATYSATDWTIEWFYRGDTRGNKTAHLFTLQNQGSGFSVVMINGKLRIQRSMDSNQNLFPSIDINEVATVTYTTWADVAFTNLQKYPHFAITKKAGVYRFYRNGTRVAILESLININITQGNLFVGYYPNRVNDAPYYMSSVRFTYGKALYTSANVPVPFVPFPVLPDITQEISLLNYISAFSNNAVSNVAKTNDKVIIYFSSIVPLANTPLVTINGITADVLSEPFNSYKASVTVTDAYLDGEVTFSILIDTQPGIPSTTFNTTTNNTSVVIDNSPITANFSTDNPNDSRPLVEVSVTFSEVPFSLTKNSFTLTNCVLSNFVLDDRNKFCTFSLSALTTGTMSAVLLVGSFTDEAGNLSVASSIFTRTVTVSAVVVDSNFSNVICLLQPTTNVIQDLSYSNSIVNVNNVSVVSNTSPASINTSMYFNGIDSSLDINLGQTLPINVPYTIEMFMYAATGTLFKLNSPVAQPASFVTNSSFRATWNDVVEANKYVVDVATNPFFNNYVTGYKHREVTDNEVTLGSTSFSIDSPNALSPKYISDRGAVLNWQKSGTDAENSNPIVGYRYELSTNQLFTNKLTAYDNAFTPNTYAEVGNLSSLEYVALPVTNVGAGDEEVIAFNNNQGVLLTGLFSNQSYPKLWYVLEESSIRLYPKDGYSIPAVAEDIELFRWNHIAIVNTGKYTYLYVDGNQEDRVLTKAFGAVNEIGYSISGFKGYITGLRITKGYPRYTTETYTVPTLPFFAG